MAYESSTYSSQDDLINKLFTFAVTTIGGGGVWTQDQLNTTTNEAALHHTAGANIYVSFDWDGTNSIGIHQALGYTGGNSPGTHPNDSGNGDTGALNERRVAGIGNGSGNYWFFSNFGATADFIYVVVLPDATSTYRHFGFGELIKVGDWTGGAFAYGHEWDTANANKDDPASGAHSFLLDGAASANANECATVHMEGFQNAPASCKWGVCGIKNITPGNDTAGNGRYRIQGGARSGPYVETFLPFAPSVSTGLVPGIPIALFAINQTPTPDRAYFMGFMPDCRMIQMGPFTAGQELTIGSETWKVFPAVRKQFLQNDTEESWNMGVAYRKA